MRDSIRAKKVRANKTSRVGTTMRNAAERANRRAVSRALSTRDWDGIKHVARPERVVGVWQ
jgi:hypothetical protein